MKTQWCPRTQQHVLPFSFLAPRRPARGVLAEAKRDHEHTSTHLCNSLITAYRFPLLVLLFLLLALRGLLYGLLRSRLLFCRALRRCGGRCGLFNGRSCHWRHPHRGAEGGTVSARCLVTLSGCPPAALLPLWILTTSSRAGVRTAVPVVERASTAASTARTAVLLTAGLRETWARWAVDRVQDQQ